MHCVNQSRNPTTTIVPLPIIPCVHCASVVLSTIFLQAQVTTQPPLVSAQHHPCHPLYCPSHSVPPWTLGFSVAPDSYDLPAAISAAAVLLVTVLTAMEWSPKVEGAISRPTSQASIRPNEVSSEHTHVMVPRVYPSMLECLYNSCSWENTMAGTEESGHYETSLHWKHALYYNLSDCQLLGEGAARDDRHRALKAAKAQVGTTHQPPPQDPPTALTMVKSAYADTLAEAPDKKREPSPISLTYASVDPPPSFPILSKVLQTSPWQKVLLAGLHLRHLFTKTKFPPSQQLEWSPGSILGILAW